MVEDGEAERVVDARSGWTNVWLDVPLVLLLVVQSALEAWLRAAEFESSPAPLLPVTDVLDSPSVPATAAYGNFHF